MNRFLSYTLTSIYALFIGTQITEAVILVPYWKSLNASKFYSYFTVNGPAIGTFYTVMTIIAVLIPLGILVFSRSKNQKVLLSTSLSVLFSLLVIVLYYSYFKRINQQFYATAFNIQQLPAILKRWELWHWIRISFELLSLSFLIQTFTILEKN